MTLVEKILDKIGYVAKSTKVLTDPYFWGLINGEEKSKLTNPYSQSPAVFACVQAKAKNISAVPFNIYRAGSFDKNNMAEVNKRWSEYKKKPIEITSGAVYKLMQQPNELNNFKQFIQAWIIYKNIKGESHVFIDPETTSGGVPSNLYNIDPKSVTPAMITRNGKEFFQGWFYSKNGQKIFIEKEMDIYDKYFNPNDPIRGMAPLTPLLTQLEFDYNARLYNKKFFDNGGTPPMLLSTDQVLTPVQFEQLKKMYIDWNTNKDRWHKAMLGQGGLKAQMLGTSNKDMQFKDAIQITTDEACMVFKVPKTELAQYEDVNRATAFSQDEGFWVKTLVPEMVEIEQLLNNKLLLPLGYEGYFDIRKIDALNFSFTKKINAIKELWNIGFSVDELNDRFDLGFEPNPNRPQINPALIVQPMLESMAAKLANLEKKEHRIAVDERIVTQAIETKASRAEEIVKALRTAKWNALQMRVRPIQGKMERELKNAFFDAEQKLFQTMFKKVSGVWAVTKEYDDAEIEKAIDSMFSLSKFTDIWDKYLKESIINGFATITEPGKMIPDVLKSVLSDRGKQITGVIDTAKEDMLEALQKALSIARDERASEQRTAQIIVDELKGKLKDINKRAATIARTETYTAWSDGRYQAMLENPPKQKQWISTRSGNYRETHVHLEDSGPIPFDKKFSNGLLYPHSPGAPAEETVNCRCVLDAVYEE